ncbi:hypothetical protein [Geobacter sp.]|uniref:hypothetical protein n=1 Tax=Geobacter sp. TaxID=46610 RepID=UPI002605C5FA|nr:hypothetical protein [Geobacter sp.]
MRFDEGIVTRSDIERHLEDAQQDIPAPGERRVVPLPVTPKVPTSGGSSSHAGHFVMEVALHALLPAPLDFFLPVAASAFRR